MRKAIIEGHFSSAQKLEKFIILEVPPQIVYEVADVVAAQLGWA